MYCGTKRTCLCPVSLGLAFGIACGLSMMVFAWVAYTWGVGVNLVNQYGEIYYGYAPTLVGGLIGGLWGLLEGFIFGAIIALFYDLFACMCKCRCCKGTVETTCPCCATKERPEPGKYT